MSFDWHTIGNVIVVVGTIVVFAGVGNAAFATARGNWNSWNGWNSWYGWVVEGTCLAFFELCLTATRRRRRRRRRKVDCNWIAVAVGNWFLVVPSPRP